jgi:ankyrin repeat protein
MKRVLLAGLLICLPVRGDSSLTDAIKNSDRAAIKALLAKHVDVNTAEADGTTPLHWAAEKEDLETVKLLLKSGADAKATNRYGITPLTLSCQNGNGPIVKVLLGAGADPNTRQWGGESVLMIAARTGKVEPVEALLARKAEVNVKEKKGQTAIMWAAAEGNAQVVDLLIKAGADFRTPLDSGFTPLLFAVREGRADVVKVLLNAGGDVNEAVDAKRKVGRGLQTGVTPLLVAIENGHFEMALDLVKAGADPNDQRGGYTALHNITWVRKPNHGEDEDGLPPPDGSGKVQSLEFVRQLVALGADVNAKIANGRGGKNVLNLKGATPFLLASKTADLALLKLLHELGANPNITNADGDTPVIAAAGLGTPTADEVAGTEDEVLEVLEWLVSIGADLNAVDKNGETAMHGAAYKNLPKVVHFLATHGAKIEVWNQKDKWGWTPLLIAGGYRPGNFKPSFETIAAIQKEMLASGVTPPELPKPTAELNNSDFASPVAKKTTQ